MGANTTDPQERMSIDEDDREYYGFSGHLVPERPDHPLRREERKLMNQAGLVA